MTRSPVLKEVGQELRNRFLVPCPEVFERVDLIKVSTLDGAHSDLVSWLHALATQKHMNQFHKLLNLGFPKP